MTVPIRIAVIGGSGLYNMPEITERSSIMVDTPYGRPSDRLMVGMIHGKRVVFIPRHAEGHILNPSEVPYRANIWALKSLGVRFCIAVNACGSLREEYAPGHLVIPDQLVDYTKSERGGRTFFEDGLVAHVSVADPFCNELSNIVFGASRAIKDVKVHRGGTFVTIEGPRFSTRGESRVYRQLGFDIIGMTTCPEAFLAREAEISYTTIAHITDYDVWHMTEEVVTSDLVIQRVHDNVAAVQRIIAAAVERIDEDADFASHHALDGAFMTAPGKLSRKMIDRLAPILRDRFSAP
ncbi:MAG TPA: S-methyl-5'-thioadenosine phosphorylase [Aggregatilineales bacterium]|jgi:5'-methylthioadenosine phosphorylase|nr:S-methyl-5'-thioadenosine phosphorylase [Aggregatilineales bacterium]